MVDKLMIDGYTVGNIFEVVTKRKLVVDIDFSPSLSVDFRIGGYIHAHYRAKSSQQVKG
jgi:hypothetical protein